MTTNRTTRIVALRSSKTEEKLREIYEEVRDLGNGRRMPLREFRDRIGSAFSINAWSKWERGIMPISPAMQRELIDYVGQQGRILPTATIMQAARFYPDVPVDVYEVGRNGDDAPTALAVFFDGDAVPSVLSAPEMEDVEHQKDRRVHICISQRHVFERANRNRERFGLSWAEWLEEATRAMEQQLEYSETMTGSWPDYND